MITVTDVSLTFGGTKLFAGANLKFIPGNCYGVVGQGAGKSTFLRFSPGSWSPPPDSGNSCRNRMSVLKQDQFQYDQYQVLETVIMGNPRLYEIMKQKEALYAKPDFSEEDGVLASEAGRRVCGAQRLGSGERGGTPAPGTGAG